jgi:hypothetical protein
VIALILFLLIALMLLVLLLAMSRRPKTAEGGAQALLDARHALHALQLGLLPVDLVGRVFARQDLEYAASAGPAQIQQLFLEERRRIALAWVSQVRSQILSLKEFHFGRSRFFARLSLATEVSLAIRFAALLCECRVLQIALYLRGPYAAPRLVANTMLAAARLCSVSEKSLGFLTTGHSKSFPDDSVGDHASLL